MLVSAENVEDLVEALEVRFLANRDDHLHFGLLTDFQDAAEETVPGDEALLDLARERIEDLNEKHGRAETFFLFHRPRRWNAQERVWMGHERKRGKLADLNRLLRGSGADRFSLVVGETAVLPGVRYVITLDTDTQLPRDAARQFVGAMAHPLNRARFRRGLAIEWSKATEYCSRASARASPARTARGMRACTAAIRASIPIREPSPTCTRTCSAKARSSARASTTSTRSSGPSAVAFRRTGS